MFKRQVLEPVQTSPPDSEPRVKVTLKQIAYIIGALILFLFALNLMTSSLQHLSRNIVETIIQATSNPFTGLFIGLLITAMMQSSSTTTSLVIALVASGSLTLQSGVFIIMGANVGTTITSTIVSLGFINRKKEFKRAVAVGTYHCFFNLLTLVVLFPLEYYYGFLSSVSEKIAVGFLPALSSGQGGGTPDGWSVFDPAINFMVQTVPSGLVLIVLSFALLFGSILLFRKIISDLLKAKSPGAFARFFFKNQLKSFSWGLLTTAAIRSSTITTSVVVPIVAKKIATLRQAAPFIMGANVGTTITGFLAAALSPTGSNVMSIAIAHFLFNTIGVLLFFPLPALRQLPVKLADSLGTLTLKYRLAGFVFLLLTFFFIPFTLIYLNQDSFKNVEVVYEQNLGQEKTFYRIKSRFNLRTGTGEWKKYYGKEEPASNQADLIFPVSVKGMALFVGRDMYLFNKPGFCWDGEDAKGKFEVCVEKTLSKFSVSNITFDSVYHIRISYQNHFADSVTEHVYLSAIHKIILARDMAFRDSVVRQEQVILFQEK